MQSIGEILKALEGREVTTLQGSRDVCYKNLQCFQNLEGLMVMIEDSLRIVILCKQRRPPY